MGPNDGSVKLDLPGFGDVFAKYVSVAEREASLAEYRTKFGSDRVDFLLGRYGGVEVVRKNGDVVGLKPPTSIPLLEDAEVKRHLAHDHTGINGYRTLGKGLSAATLIRLARGKLVEAAMTIHQLRVEPSVLRARVESALSIHPELVQSQNSPRTLQDLSSRPTIIAGILRGELYNLLRTLAEWSLIIAYLDDIERLAERGRGMLDPEYKRDRFILMVSIANHVDSEIRRAEEYLRRTLLVKGPMAQVFARTSADDDPNGTEVNLDFSQPVVEAQDLTGFFVRFACPSAPYRCVKERWSAQENAKEEWSKRTRQECGTRDLVNYFLYKATEEEKALYPEDVHARMDDLLHILDFRDLLRHDYWRMPSYPDSRQQADAKAQKLLHDILDKSHVERHIKHLDSLDKQSTLDKIWKDFDAVSAKLARGQRLEELCGVSDIHPQWNVSPSADSETDESENLTSETAGSALPLADQPRRRRPPAAQAAPEPAFVKPFWVGSSRLIDPSGDEAQMSSTSIPKRTKRDGGRTQVTPEPSTQASPDVTSTGTISFPIFLVSARIKAIWDRVLSGGTDKGQLAFSDFEKALTALGFSKESSYGSVIRYLPPNPRDIPYICHKPHGTDATVGPVMQRQFAAHLNALYGWTKEWFGLKQ
ncbi:hypothetical protein EXIGLDRAFT_839752 [Exidia glandulosa HHB12029]|uniref:Uncharacterized protein n=1 Tax=Exidia glandulosa HHB12029 TaxID=1314781 RepID=A0A165EUI3_EXIGL|nr:hypothetical protein EXIGLDRAFT_839752 [Exidia glandulosa HHB12029]